MFFGLSDNILCYDSGIELKAALSSTQADPMLQPIFSKDSLHQM